MSTTTIDLSTWLEDARRTLAAVADQPSIEAVTLLGGVLGKSRAWIFAHQEALINVRELAQLTDWVNRRLDGEPLPYLLGKWEFYGLEFDVSPAVLIPRPETELLVDLARDWLQNHPGKPRVIDVGTGSGCIACSLAHWVPGLSIVAADISGAALAVAARNIQKHDLTKQVFPVQADLTLPFKGQFDLILANLPYIPLETLRDLDVSHHEPDLALNGGADGLRLIETLLQQAATRLADGGRIMLEIEIGQELSAPMLAAKYFPKATIQVHPDLAGLPRILIIDQ